MTTAIGTTDVDICARALVLLGNKPVDSLEGDDDKTVACKNIYDLVRDVVLTHHPWRFTMAKFNLAQLTAAPVNEFEFAYQLPAERINHSPRAVYNSTDDLARPITKGWDVFEDKVFAQFEPLIIDIQVDQAEARWPPHVVTFATFALAAMLAEAVTDQTDKAKMWHLAAFGTPSENMKGGYSQVARVQDGQGRPTPAIEDFSLLEVRVVGVSRSF